jgi:hypothetical protein
MKYLLFITTLALSFSFAVSDKAAPQVTPVVKSSSTPFVCQSLMGQINLAYIRVGEDQKNGKLTPDQAKRLKLKLKDLFRQVFPDLRSKDKNSENMAHINQASQQLQTIKQTIP